MTDRSFGRLPAPDPRDARFPMRLLLPKAGVAQMPRSKTWRFRYAALDQGRTGTCVAHAWTHFLMADPISHRRTRVPDPFELYDRIVQHDEWTENDSDTARQFGTSVRAGAAELLARKLVKGGYVWAASMQQLIEWVLTQGPAVLGSDWGYSMFDVPQDGIVRYRPGEGIAGGHAYLIRSVKMATGLAGIQNSWGGWGKAGFAWIPLDDLEQLLFARGRDGEACAAIEAPKAALTKAREAVKTEGTLGTPP